MILVRNTLLPYLLTPITIRVAMAPTKKQTIPTQTTKRSAASNRVVPLSFLYNLAGTSQAKMLAKLDFDHAANKAKGIIEIDLGMKANLT